MAQTFRLSERNEKDLDLLKEVLGITKTELVNRAIEEYVQRLSYDPEVQILLKKSIARYEKLLKGE